MADAIVSLSAASLIDKRQMLKLRQIREKYGKGSKQYQRQLRRVVKTMKPIFGGK